LRKGEKLQNKIRGAVKRGFGVKKRRSHSHLGDGLGKGTKLKGGGLV